MNFEDTFYGRPNTVKTYVSLFKNHIVPHVSAEHCLLFNELDLTNLINIHWDGLSVNTKSTLIRLLAGYIKFNNGKEIDASNMIKTLVRSVQQREIHALTREQAEALMRKCETSSPKFYPAILLGLHAGLRRGEVYGLQFGDIDFIKQRIKVCRSYNGPTKNGKTRYVPMSQKLGTVLSNWMFKKTLTDRLFKVEDPNPRLHRLCRIAGVPSVNFHALRHTYATLALESGVSPRRVQEWLGHAALTTTLNIYWSLINQNKESLDFLPE